MFNGLNKITKILVSSLNDLYLCPNFYIGSLWISKYTIFITGSNAKMLSGEINTTLGGRFLIAEVYPYSFKEFLAVHQVSTNENDLLATDGRARVIRAFDEYLRYGGLPAAALLPAKRNYLSSVYQKIYMGDIIARNKITNVAGIRVLVRKMADKESNCKYYFVDPGILGLFLIDKDAMLLENLVAIQLFRIYGHDMDNGRVFFYNDGYEVDFYVPDDELAIQVSYSLREEETRKRETEALQKLPNRLPCRRRLILTYDEEETTSDKHGTIEVMPVWKWILEDSIFANRILIN